MQKSSQAFAPRNGTRMKFMVHLCFALCTICNHIFAYLMWLGKYAAYFCNEFAFQVLFFGQFSSKSHMILRPFRTFFFSLQDFMTFPVFSLSVNTMHPNIQMLAFMSYHPTDELPANIFILNRFHFVGFIFKPTSLGNVKEGEDTFYNSLCLSWRQIKIPTNIHWSLSSLKAFICKGYNIYVLCAKCIRLIFSRGLTKSFLSGESCCWRIPFFSRHWFHMRNQREGEDQHPSIGNSSLRWLKGAFKYGHSA